MKGVGCRVHAFGREDFGGEDVADNAHTRQRREVVEVEAVVF